jgi:uncharacterized glyoxalase superfamily protein PhnB
MPKKIDPLNKKNYSALTAALCVVDVKAAAEFYQKAFGFQRRGIMNGPDGKPVHAELTLRGTTLMLGPEMPEMGARSAKTVGASPTTLYLMVEKVDQVVAKAVKLGAKPQGRCRICSGAIAVDGSWIPRRNRSTRWSHAGSV